MMGWTFQAWAAEGRRAEDNPPRRWWVAPVPVVLAVVGILIATAAVTTGQDQRRQRDQTQLDKDLFYWENELAQAELTHAPPEKLAGIEATLQKVRANRLPSYARYGRQFTQWDGYRYEEIVDQGYLYHLPGDSQAVKDSSTIRRPGWPEPRLKNVVWYPLYPVLGWLVKEGMAVVRIGGTGLPADWSLTCVSWLCALLASGVVALVAQRHYYQRRTKLMAGVEGDGAAMSREGAVWVVAALFFGPCSVFLYANFTESLFVLLLAAFLYCIQGRWWWRAALVAAVASACRSQGVLFGPILALSFILRNTQAWPLRLGKAALLGLVSAVGLLGYMAYLQGQFGDALAFMHAQKNWNVGVDFQHIAYALDPVHVWGHITRYAFHAGPIDWPRLWEALCLVWPPVLLLALGWRYLSLELQAVGWLFWGLPFISNSMAGNPPLDSQWMSMGRFMAVCLPVQIIVGGMAVRRRWVGIVYLCVSAAVFGVFAYKFGNGEWVG